MSRALQIRFNGKALARDITGRQWGKVTFHLRGLLRAILPAVMAF